MRQGIVGGITGAIIAVGISLLAQSWTTPRTWVTGELVGAGQMNTHVRDNLSYLYTAIERVSGVEAGTVIFTTAAGCPSGYVEYTPLQGRYLVGMPSGGTAAEATVGTALTDRENRAVGQHAHTQAAHGHGGHRPGAHARH